MNTQTKRLYRQLLVATLLMGGTFNMTVPVLAQSVPTAPLTGAGTEIKNKATATYEDPSNPGTINATSNEVIITVAEVAGIAVTGATPVDRNGSSVSNGDILDFDFTITNVGNDTTAIYIPGKTILNTGGRIVGGQIGSTAGANSVYIVRINGNTLTTPVAVPDAGVQSDNATFIAAIQGAGYAAFDGSIDVNQEIVVRVPVTVTETVATNPISVQFGNTADPGTQNRQNIPYVVDATTDDDVRTADITSEPAPRNLGPANGEREAAAFQSIPLGTQVTTRALATVLKTRSLYTPNTSVLDDDQIRYRLDLRVEGSYPNNASIAVGNLEGTALANSIAGAGAPTGNVILVSDVIPANTVFDETFTPTAPSGGWVVVYSETDPTAPNATALNAQWSTTPRTAANAGLVKRIGIVRTGSMTAGSSTLTDTNGFQFQVKTATGFAGGQILNIAQSFGHTQGDSDLNRIIYDESGDQFPNNFEGTTTPYADGAGGFDPTNDDGIALATYGSDPSSQTTNNTQSNQGTGADGEVNLFSIDPPGSILTGPRGVPGATGPGGSTQTDYVNQAISPPVGKNPADTLTDAETGDLVFNSTVRNPNSLGLNNVVLKPIPAAQADYVADSTADNQQDPNTGYGTNTTLPDGTTVKIESGGQTAIYEWDSGTNTFTLQAGSSVVKLTTLNGQVSLDYTVTVNLGDGAAQNAAYPVAIVAFVDEGGNNEFDRSSSASTAESIFNMKIVRTYTGFVKLTKEARILDDAGNQITVDANNNPITDPEGFTTNPARPQPGWKIEYRISYENISTPASTGGSGSVQLSASNFRIFEDGTGDTTNPRNGTWAATTSHVLTKAVATQGTVSFYNTTIDTANPGSGVPEAEINSGYVNFIGSLAPNGTAGTPQGNFKFQRLVK
ncbi:beta strand repeat-containing protein [Scytonema millei]|uniref:DUF7925 domain-containing protein n=1 Tax=Scytonema millei VB511283 TaxID=1245923 RepID=A0A9X5E251_9CYAN|nr:hypothetical protein [Scytonema millei]NHC33438.1 hypothetical protein [Scytonema millei VB511283]